MTVSLLGKRHRGVSDAREHLKDGQHDVVDVAEAGRLRSLGVVQSPRPVDSHVSNSRIQLQCAVDRAARVQATIVVEAMKNLQRGSTSVGRRTSGWGHQWAGASICADT